MKFGQTQAKAAAVSPRQQLMQKYNTCRVNLLLVILFTLISLATYYFNGTYFLFSAFLPLLFFAVGAEYAAIADGSAQNISDYAPEAVETLSNIGAGIFLAIGLVIAIVLLSVYFICWLCSKKHPAAMVVVAVYFAIDCLALLINFDISAILDVVFHVWVMYYLVSAIVANSKLKKLPPDEAAPVEGTYTVINGEPVPSSTASPIDFAEIPTNENTTDDRNDQDEQN